MSHVFDDVLGELRKLEVSSSGVDIYALDPDKHQVVFVKVMLPSSVPEHAHGSQWGIILEGESHLTVEGTLIVLTKGDCVVIPPGAMHSCIPMPGLVAIDIFDVPDRHKVRDEASERQTTSANDHAFDSIFPELPEADFPFGGQEAWVLDLSKHQVVISRIGDSEVASPEHSHCREWGVVLEGELELTVDGATTMLHRGDCYVIPKDTIHSSVAKPDLRVLGIFDEPGRLT